MAGEGIGAAEVALVMRRALNKNVQVRDFDFRSFDTKVGFMGDHSILHVHYIEENVADPRELSFFVKRVPEIERYRTFILKQGLFLKEQEMYEKLLPLMQRSLQQKLPVPDCYLFGHQSYAIFQDLGRLGCHMVDKYDYLGVAECEAAFKAIALLHAGSVAAEIKTGKLMITHARYYHEALITDGSEGNSNISRQWHYSSLQTTLSLMQKMPRYSDTMHNDWDSLRERMHQMWDETAVMASGNSSKFKNVISHGDLWINNVMFRNNDDGVHVALVDFQVYRYAPPALDLLMLLYLTTSRDVRQRHTDRLLEVYYETFFGALIKSGVDEAEVPISREQLNESIIYHKLFGVVIAARYFPTCLKQGLLRVPQNTNPQNVAQPVHNNPYAVLIKDNSDELLDAFTNGPNGAKFEERIIACIDDIIDYLEEN